LKLLRSLLPSRVPRRIVAEIRRRLPEQLERDIKGIKEYPKEIDQSSVERSNPKTNPAKKSSQDDHNLVPSMLMRPTCFIQFILAHFEDDARTICTLLLKSIWLCSWPFLLPSTKATISSFDDRDCVAINTGLLMRVRVNARGIGSVRTTVQSAILHQHRCYEGKVTVLTSVLARVGCTRTEVSACNYESLSRK